MMTSMVKITIKMTKTTTKMTTEKIMMAKTTARTIKIMTKMAKTMTKMIKTTTRITTKRTKMTKKILLRHLVVLLISGASLVRNKPSEDNFKSSNFQQSTRKSENVNTAHFYHFCNIVFSNVFLLNKNNQIIFFYGSE